MDFKLNMRVASPIGNLYVCNADGTICAIPENYSVDNPTWQSKFNHGALLQFDLELPPAHATSYLIVHAVDFLVKGQYLQKSQESNHIMLVKAKSQNSRFTVECHVQYSTGTVGTVGGSTKTRKLVKTVQIWAAPAPAPPPPSPPTSPPPNSSSHLSSPSSPTVTTFSLRLSARYKPHNVTHWVMLNPNADIPLRSTVEITATIPSGGSGTRYAWWIRKQSESTKHHGPAGVGAQYKNFKKAITTPGHYIVGVTVKKNNVTKSKTWKFIVHELSISARFRPAPNSSWKALSPGQSIPEGSEIEFQAHLRPGMLYVRYNWFEKIPSGLGSLGCQDGIGAQARKLTRKPNLTGDYRVSVRASLPNSYTTSLEAFHFKIEEVHTTGVNPKFIILMPSLGLPKIVDSDRILEVVILAHPDICKLVASGETPKIDKAKKVIADKLYLKYLQPGTCLADVTQMGGDKVLKNGIVSIQLGSLYQLRDQFWALKDENNRPTGTMLSLSNPAFKYFNKALKRMYQPIYLRIKIFPSEGTHLLLNKNQDQLGRDYGFEREILHQAIADIKKPFTNCPMLDDFGTSNGLPARKPIQLFHPFSIRNNYNQTHIAHMPDFHISHRTELIDQRIRKKISQSMYATKIKYEEMLRSYSNPNDKFKQAFAKPDYEFAILGGDLIDYNRGLGSQMQNDLKIPTNASTGNDLFHDYRFNRNWILLYELMIRNYRVPMFTLVGNHEYLLNPFSIKPKMTGMIAASEGIPPKLSNFAGGLNLAPPQVKELIPEYISEVEILGDFNFLREEEDAVAWYFLVINPFSDYAFRFGNAAFLMLDWNVHSAEYIKCLPHPTKSFAENQMRMIKQWGSMNKNRTTVLSLHAPIYNPFPTTGNRQLRQGRAGNYFTFKYWKDTWPDDWANDMDDDPNEYIIKNLAWGAVRNLKGDDTVGFRNDFITLMDSLGINLILSGHAHTHKLFQTRGKRVYLKSPNNKSQWNANKPMYAVTTSSGPWGYQNETGGKSGVVKRRPGYRSIKLTLQGITDLDEETIE